MMDGIEEVEEREEDTFEEQAKESPKPRVELAHSLFLLYHDDVRLRGKERVVKVPLSVTHDGLSVAKLHVFISHTFSELKGGCVLETTSRDPNFEIRTDEELEDYVISENSNVSLRVVPLRTTGRRIAPATNVGKSHVHSSQQQQHVRIGSARENSHTNVQDDEDHQDLATFGDLRPILPKDRSLLTMSALEDQLSAYRISWGAWKSENNYKTVEDLFDEVRQGICDLCADGSGLVRVVRLVRVHLRHPESKMILVNALKIVNGKKSISHVNRLPAYKYNNAEEPYFVAMRSIQEELGFSLWGHVSGIEGSEISKILNLPNEQTFSSALVHQSQRSLRISSNRGLLETHTAPQENSTVEQGEPPSILEFIAPQGFGMPSEEREDSSSFPGLRTTYLINTLVADLVYHDIPREGSFVTVDHLRPDITRLWQWMSLEDVRSKILSRKAVKKDLDAALEKVSLKNAPVYARASVAQLQAGFSLSDTTSLIVDKRKSRPTKLLTGSPSGMLTMLKPKTGSPFGVSSPFAKRAERKRKWMNEILHPPPMSLYSRFLLFWNGDEKRQRDVQEKAEMSKQVPVSLPKEMDLLTEQVLGRWLNQYGVDTSRWGMGQSKHLWQLLEEIQKGEAELMLTEKPVVQKKDKLPWKKKEGEPHFKRHRSMKQLKSMMHASHPHILRIIKVAKVEILHPSDTNLVLVETHQQLADNRLRVRFKTLSEKFKPGETPWQAALRGISEEILEPDVYTLNQKGFRIVQNRPTVEEMKANVEIVSIHAPVIEESPSPSYPGLETRYILHKFSCIVKNLPSRPFRTDEPSKGGGYVTHFWQWETKSHVRDMTSSLLNQVRFYQNLVPGKERDEKVLFDWLFQAARENQVDVIKVLCGYSEASIEYDRGRSFLTELVDQEDPLGEDIEEEMEYEELDPSSIKDKAECTPLRVAALHGAEEAVEVLIQIQIANAKAKIQEELKRPTQEQSKDDYTARMYKIVNQPDHYGCTLLYYAAIANRVELVENLLASKNAAVNSVCLHSCVSRGAIDVISVLLRRLRFETKSTPHRLLFGVENDPNIDLSEPEVEQKYLVSTPKADNFDYFKSLLTHIEQELNRTAAVEKLITKVADSQHNEIYPSSMQLNARMVLSSMSRGPQTLKPSTSDGSLSPKIISTLLKFRGKSKKSSGENAPSTVPRDIGATAGRVTVASGQGEKRCLTTNSNIPVRISKPLRALEVVLQFCNPTAHYYKSFLRIYLHRVIELDDDAMETLVFREFLAKSRFPIHIALMCAHVLRSIVGLEKRFWESYEYHAEKFQDIVCQILDCCEDQLEAEELLRERADIPPWRKADGTLVTRPYSHRHKSTCSYLAIKYRLKKVVAHKFFTTQNDSIWFNDENDSLYTKGLGSISNLTATLFQFENIHPTTSSVGAHFGISRKGLPSNRSDLHRKTRLEGFVAFFLRVPGLKGVIQGLYRTFVSLVLLLLLVLCTPILWLVPFSYSLRVIVDLPRTEFACCYFKWSVWSMSYVAYLATFAYVATANSMDNQPDGLSFTKAESVFLVFFLGNCLGLFEQVASIGWGPFFGHSVNIIDSLSALFIAVAYAVRILDRSTSPGETFDVCMSFGALLAAFRLFHLFSASKELGPLWITMQYVVPDVVSFLSLLGVVMIAFILAFVFLLGGQGVIGFETPGYAFSSLLWSVFEAFSTYDPNQLFQTQLFQLFLFFFLLVASILLPNLLIALMTKRFETVQQTARLEWLFSLAQLIDKYSNMPILPPPFNLLTVIPNLIFLFFYKSQSLYDPDSFFPDDTNRILLLIRACFGSKTRKKTTSVVPSSNVTDKDGASGEASQDEMQALAYRSTRRVVVQRFIQRCRAKEAEESEVKDRLEYLARNIDRCQDLILAYRKQIKQLSGMHELQENSSILN